MDFATRLRLLRKKVPFPPKKGDKSLFLLNIAQFLGVINDNLFKFVMAFLLIDRLGQDHASSILSATGAVYVIPFLLFSSSAGILADRFSKQKLLVIMKIAEMTIMLLAFFAFAYVSVIGCYTLLFLLSTHSALFGPSKYGIIPELVPKDKVSRANGLVTSFTYLAIIVGTFLASFLTEMTDRRFTLIIVFCFLCALGGFISAYFIKHTASQGSQKKVNFLFVRDILATLKSCRQIPHLLPAIFGSAFFLFIGGFTQLNIIPYAMQCLKLPEVSGGYLFLVTALGIAFGSYLGGKASRKRVELGLPCLAGLFIALSLFLLGIFPESLVKTVICLIFIGVCGGIFIVPFDTFIQLSSPDSKRGQTIAAANFLSFFGVLIASALLFVFAEILHLSPAGGFFVMGIFTLLFVTIEIFFLSDLFLSYLSQKILRPLFRFHPQHLEKLPPNTFLILENSSWKSALLVLGTFPNIHLIIPSTHPKSRPWLHRLFASFHPVKHEGIANQAKQIQDAGNVPCLFLEGSSKAFLESFKNKSFNFLIITIKRDNSKLTMHTRSP